MNLETDTKQSAIDQRSLAVTVAQSAESDQRDALSNWIRGLLEIRDANLPSRHRAQAAIKLTLASNVVWPIVKIIGRETKRLAWDDRGLKSRFGLGGLAIGMTFFGGQGAGIAALGTAIGVPLWVVFGAGGAFAGMLLDELQAEPNGTGSREQTTYRTIDAVDDSGLQ